MVVLAILAGVGAIAAGYGIGRALIRWQDRNDPEVTADSK